MTVQELMDRLSTQDLAAQVFMTQPTHDYWRMVAVVPVAQLDETLARFTESHNSLIVAEEGDPGTQTVLVLS